MHTEKLQAFWRFILKELKLEKRQRNCLGLEKKLLPTKIDEYLRTGKLKKLDNIHGDKNAQAISLLTRVSGIGPVKAADLVRNGIKSIEDLRNNQDKLNHHQIIGLKYFEDFEKKIPRSEISQVDAKIKEILINLDSEYSVTICGSYRRGKPESGDIDALVTHPSLKESKCKKNKEEGEMLKKIISALSEDLVTDVISAGETKFMGVCNFSKAHPFRRLDIRLIPSEQYHCAVLYFTGSDVFNKTMRAHALQQKFTLNEYSLRPIGVTGMTGEAVPISSEEEIFDYINYPYKTPEERNL